MKSHLQKQRELEREPIYKHNKSLLRMVKCPKCKRKMTKENYEKYGKCYTCKVNEDIRRI